MCLQETHVTDAAEATSWFSSSGFLTVTAPGTAHSRGQVLLYRPSFSFVNSWVELEERFLMAEFRKRGSFFRIASVYAPNRNPERDKFFTSCLDFADRSVPTILCGDFNAVFDRAKDRRGSDPAVTVRESFVSLGLLGCLAPSPSRSSRLHLAKARWFLPPPPHRFYWLLVYLALSCVFLFYCSISFL